MEGLGGWKGGGKRTYRQGDVHADEIVRLLLQRVHPQLPFLPASGGGRSIPLQKTLPPFVGVHFRGPPSPASCRLSGGNLRNGGGSGGEESGVRLWWNVRLVKGFQTL